MSFIFQGLDAFDYLKVDGRVSGTVPPVGRRGTELRSEPLAEEFSRSRPGEVTARSRRVLQAQDGAGTEFEVEAEHRIQYDGRWCGGKEDRGEGRTARLKSVRNYFNYQEEGQVKIL